VLYKSLQTNLPKEVMQFEAMAFDAALPSFVSSDDMLEYLRSYAAAFHLEDMVRFNRTVTAVRPVFDDHFYDESGAASSSSSSSSSKSPPPLSSMAVRREPSEPPQPRAWRLTHRKTAAGSGFGKVEGEEEEVLYYDYVVVANGHYEKPHWPVDLCEGLATFPRDKLLHSRDYDTPEPFKGKRVVCVGSRASGTDLAREIAEVAEAVWVVDRGLKDGDGVPRNNGGARGNIRRRATLVRLTKEGGAVLRDGSTPSGACGADPPRASSSTPLGDPLETLHGAGGDEALEHVEHVDAVILCTGYDYHFPFLEHGVVDGHDQDGDGGRDGGSRQLVTSESRRVHPLYLQLFHAKYPSLAFVGIPHSVVPNPLHEFQATYLAAVFGNTNGAGGGADDEGGGGKEEEEGDAAAAAALVDAAGGVAASVAEAAANEEMELVGPVEPLPPLAERMEWVERLYARQGDVRNTHHLGDKQWDYCLDLLRRAGRGGTPAPEADAAEEGGTGAKPPLSAVVELRRRQRDFIRLSKEVYDDAGGARPAYTGEPDTYRARQYRVDRAANSWGVTVPP
jgi:hypothetical protein